MNTSMIGTAALANVGIAAVDINAVGTPANGDVVTYDDTQAGNLLRDAPGTFPSSPRFKTDVATIRAPKSGVYSLPGRPELHRHAVRPRRAGGQSRTDRWGPITLRA